MLLSPNHLLELYFELPNISGTYLHRRIYFKVVFYNNPCNATRVSNKVRKVSDEPKPR